MTTAPGDSAASERPTERRFLPEGRRLVVAVLLVALVLMVLVRSLLLEVFYIPSGSMEPGLRPGDRVAVWRPGAEDVHRGQLVVFDGRGSLAPYDPHANPITDGLRSVGSWVGVRTQDHVYVKRVIGVAGDRVSCCTADGKVEVNGRALDEPYLHPGDKPSDTPFSVTVPEGRMWVMGDHRSDSTDSRSLIGAPGGGMIRTEKVIGEPVAVIWPWDRLGTVR